tara:strand:- start:373 stop:735 length:363 start_codon:yes stop_codon:yes gene_type:complete
MIEYFHIYENGHRLIYVGLVLSKAVETLNSCREEGRDVQLKSYMLDPAKLQAMSDEYDEARSIDWGLKADAIKYHERLHEIMSAKYRKKLAKRYGKTNRLRTEIVAEIAKQKGLKCRDIK